MRSRYKAVSEFWELVHVRLAWAPQTEEDAARELGVSQASFNRWRNQAALPDPTRYAKLARWLDTDEATVARAVDRQRIRLTQERIARRSQGVLAS